MVEVTAPHVVVSPQVSPLLRRQYSTSSPDRDGNPGPTDRRGYCGRRRREACERRTTARRCSFIVAVFPHPEEDREMFARLGAWCDDRRKLVLGLWAAALVVGLVLASTVGGAFREEFNLPASESRTGFDILEENFGGEGTNATGTIVFRAEQGVDDPAVQTAMEELFADVEDQPGVLGVTSPYSEEGAQQVSAQGPEAG
jgi:predicted RND superfamily exporter protein